jgi:hypothetical protein
MYNPFRESGDPAEVSDEDLARQAKAGDRDPLEALVRRHQPWIFNLVVVSGPSPIEERSRTPARIVAAGGRCGRRGEA